MAFLPNQDPNQQQGAQGQTPLAPQIPTLQGTSGPSASSGSGTQAGSTNTASPGAAPTTPWQNISTYLNSNAGQAGNVAGTIANNLQNQYNTTSQAINQTQGDFGNKIQSGSVPLNQDLLTQASTHPSEAVKNPDNVTQFQKMLNASYTGPQDFSHSAEYSDLQSKVQAGQNQAALANKGTPGLMTLLQQAEGNPTQGVTSLDSLLLQESPENFGKISAAAQPFANLTGQLGQAQQGLDTSAQEAAKTTAATQQAVQNAMTGPGGAIPGIQGQLNQSLQTAAGQAKTYNDQIADITNRLNSGQQLTPEEMYQVDRSGGLGAVYGTFQNALSEGFPNVAPGFLSQFYKPGEMAQMPTLANVQTPEQAADLSALNQLMGKDLGIAPARGTPFAVPQAGAGSYDDTAMLNSLLQTLQGDQVALPQMSAEQQNSWLLDTQRLANLLGLGPSPTPINPIDQPGPATPTLSGGVPTNPTPPPPTGGTGGLLTGGGRIAR